MAKLDGAGAPHAKKSLVETDLAGQMLDSFPLELTGT
jgi:hypothetical protein